MEAYNRVYGDKFPKKPSLIEFLQITEEESRAVEEKVDDLRKHHMKRPTYKEVTILVISSSYKIFAAEQKNVFCGRAEETEA